MNPNDIALIVEKDLNMKDIDVLQMAEIINEKVEAKTPVYIAQCIDNTEDNDKQDAISTSPNPNSARDVYKNSGYTYFYVTLSGIPTMKAKLIEDPVKFNKELKAKKCKLKTIF